MKTCFKCNRELPITEFYAHSGMRDGHLNKCKECTKSDTAARVSKLSLDPKWVLNERRRHREKSRRARRNGIASISADRKRAAISKYRKEHPLKARAHRISKRAIDCGLLKRQPCEVCGSIEVEAHHDDYSKPLDVRWLCVPHHAEHHVNLREAELLSK